MSIRSAFEDFDAEWILNNDGSESERRGALARKTPFSPRFTKRVVFTETVGGRDDKKMLPCCLIVKKRPRSRSTDGFVFVRLGPLAEPPPKTNQAGEGLVERTSLPSHQPPPHPPRASGFAGRGVAFSSTQPGSRSTSLEACEREGWSMNAQQ